MNINDVGVQGVVSSDGFGLVHGHPWAKIKKKGRILAMMRVP